MMKGLRLPSQLMQMMDTDLLDGKEMILRMKA